MNTTEDKHGCPVVLARLMLYPEPDGVRLRASGMSRLVAIERLRSIAIRRWVQDSD